MNLFIDTANVDEIHAASSWGILSGVTTNPSLLAKEGRELTDVIKEICSIVPGPISVEVTSLDASGMVEQGREFSRLGDNVVIKVPICEDGLEATNILSRDGIKVNMTLVFSSNQGLMAALAGAAYVSPFVGRLDDIGHDGMEIVRETAFIFSSYGLATQIIAASIRHPMHVVEAAKAGAHISTVPFKVLRQMVHHPLTDLGIQKFLADWESLKKKA